jgi:hypothetical protein
MRLAGRGGEGADGHAAALISVRRSTFHYEDFILLNSDVERSAVTLDAEKMRDPTDVKLSWSIPVTASQLSGGSPTCITR